MKVVNIILVQTKDDRGFQFRIAKLEGAVGVFSSKGREYHVDEMLDEHQANDLAANRSYKVTVTAKAVRS